MAVSEAQLKKMLSKYKYRDLSTREILNVTSLYRDLKPLMDSYVFNDGSTRELLNLTGTIPVPYKGNTYNIPICLWLLDTYPFNPPICFVKPTSTMTIKTGKHVDANGKIYLPYLHEWKHPPSDLQGLIQILIVVFGEEPPVFSRSAPPTQYPMYPATGPPNSSYIPGGMPPYPTQAHPGNPSGFPVYPYPQGGPYPPTSGPQIFPQPPVSQVSNSGPARDGTIGEDTIRASLISAVSDKLRWRMKEEMDRAQAELNALKRTEEDLKKGHQKLEEMVTRLDQEVVSLKPSNKPLASPVTSSQGTRPGSSYRASYSLFALPPPPHPAPPRSSYLWRRGSSVFSGAAAPLCSLAPRLLCVLWRRGSSVFSGAAAPLCSLAPRLLCVLWRRGSSVFSGAAAPLCSLAPRLLCVLWRRGSSVFSGAAAPLCSLAPRLLCVLWRRGSSVFSGAAAPLCSLAPRLLCVLWRRGSSVFSGAAAPLCWGMGA
uniref:Tumor susceptibility 101 n=1 Tax=Leptobrachium leishanense TaxID=445787 RepID=A0A8C5MHX7_9ANUR